MRLLIVATGAVATIAIALWLGGLTVLGAIVAPTVFSSVPYPASADAMTLVFRRFDLLAMACGAAALASEAVRVGARVPYARVDRLRAAATVLAAALATYQGTRISPAIAALHASGVVRGVGAGGLELSHLHELAEASGKAQVALLLAVLAFQVAALARSRGGAGSVP